ncbi:MAG: phosphate acyltransferase PlsX [Ignavibacteria bacterium]|nr:phosphate acyltransferase PlsX [Ignavibacteria bacterium]
MDSYPQQCVIALDAMGGDYAPLVTIRGAYLALQESNGKFDILLVGKQEELLKIIEKEKIDFPLQNIVNASETIEMGDAPTTALKSKENSLAVCAELIKQGKAHAFVSAGNTGAVMAISTIRLGRIEGISRPALGTIVPTLKNKCLVLDVGANVDTKPNNLYEFAVMGSVYMQEIFGVKSPKVGLLSIGEEDSKGNEVTIAANKLLRESKLNFYGNVEGRDVLKGEVDVIVCDGFVGNVVLKFAEGFLHFLVKRFKESAEKSFTNKLRIGLAKGILKDILKVFDYQEYGGVPLFGVNGITIIGHGSSSELAIKNMIIRAYETHQHRIVERIKDAIQSFHLSTT